MTGWEHRQLIGAANPNNGFFGAVVGTPTIDTTIFNAGGGGTASMKVDSTAAAHTVGAGGNGAAFVAGTYFSAIFYLNWNSGTALACTPAASMVTGVNANGNFRLDLLNTGALRVFGATGSVSATSTTTLTGSQWYKVLVEFDARANPGIIRCYIFDTQEEISINTIAQASANFTAINLGNSSTAAGLRSVLNFDDYMLYNAAGDYDLLKGIGPYGIRLLIPNAVGTHGTPGNFQDESSVALTSGDTTSWNKLDDLTAAADTTTYVKQVTTTGYLEYKLAPPTVGNGIIAVRAYMAVLSSTTTANNISFRMFDGTTESADLQSATVGSTSVVWRGAQVPRPSGGDWPMSDWLNQNVRFRVGYSSDINPVPQITAIGVEIAVNGQNKGPQQAYGPSTEQRRTMANL